MDLVRWDSRLIIDTGQLKQALSFWFDEQLIKIKEDTNGVSNSDWIYAEIPVVGTNKIFRFAIYLLTGKALVLFIQSGYLWLTGDLEGLLIGGLQYKLKREGEVIPVYFQWRKEKDLCRGEKLTCLGWFFEDDFRNYKRDFVEGLGYSELW